MTTTSSQMNFKEHQIEKFTNYKPYLRPRDELIDPHYRVSQLNAIVRFPHMVLSMGSRDTTGICSIMTVSQSFASVKTVTNIPIYENAIFPEDDPRYEEFSVSRYDIHSLGVPAIMDVRERLLERIRDLQNGIKLSEDCNLNEYLFLCELLTNTIVPSVTATIPKRPGGSNYSARAYAVLADGEYACDHINLIHQTPKAWNVF